MGTEGKRIPQVLPKPTKPYPIFTNRTNIPTEPPLPPRLPPSPPIITFITHSPSRPPYGLPHYPILASPVASPGPRNSSEVGRLPRPRSAQRSKLIRTARPRVVRRPPECNSSRDFGIRFSSLVGFGKSSFFFFFGLFITCGDFAVASSPERLCLGLLGSGLRLLLRASGEYGYAWVSFLSLNCKEERKWKASKENGVEVSSIL